MSRRDVLLFVTLGLAALPMAAAVPRGGYPTEERRGLGAGADGGQESARPTDAPPVVIQATDLHYLTPQLARAKGLLDGSSSSGAMMSAYTDPIADALVEEVVAARPAAFVMTGDLANEGELECHEALLGKLEKVARADVPVLVIPGNHDIRKGSSRHATSGLFGEMYARYGRDQALSCDRDSLSYLWELDGRTRLLLLDVNAVDVPGRAPDSTVAWVREQLEQARLDGVRVLGFSHQVVASGGEGYSGIAVENAGEILGLYEELGVRVNFSGHIHVQRVMASRGGLTEAITMSAAIAPNQYARIEVGESRLSYATKPLDVSSWARRAGSDDPRLLDFGTFAHDYLYGIQYQTAYQILVSAGASADEVGTLASYAAEVNCAYYYGRLNECPFDRDIVDRWVDLTGETATRYGYTVEPSAWGDQNSFEIDL